MEQKNVLKIKNHAYIHTHKKNKLNDYHGVYGFGL